MTPEELLEALLDYGVFSSTCEDDYGHVWYAIGEKPIGGLPGNEYENKWKLSESELVTMLELFQESRKS